MAEPSKENPENLFNFKVTPLTKINLPIDALCDPEFNPQGYGVPVVTEKGVEFTVRNSETKVAGYLCRYSTAFQFSSSLGILTVIRPSILTKIKNYGEKAMQYGPDMVELASQARDYMLGKREEESDSENKVNKESDTDRIHRMKRYTLEHLEKNNVVSCRLTPVIPFQGSSVSRSMLPKCRLFSFKVTQSRKLELVLKELLNFKGFIGIIEVYSKGFKISGRNLKDEEVGFLFVHRYELESFQCSKKYNIKGLKVILYDVWRIFKFPENTNKRVKVFLNEGSDQITFNFGDKIDYSINYGAWFDGNFLAEPSKENPEKLFNFKITPLTKFYLAFAALCDPKFNPQWNGVFEVTEKGVQIIVRNSKTKVAGYLYLNSTALTDFQFSSNCKGKLMRVNFRRIFQLITLADSCNDDSITIFHIDGSNDLTINFGNDSFKEFKVELFQQKQVELLPTFTGFEGVPEIIFLCEAIIPSDSLREMVDRLKKINNQLVSVNISENIVRFHVDDDLQPWEFEIASGQNHQAQFFWPHLRMLEKASHTAPELRICFLNEPTNMITTHFTLRELGDLKFISEYRIPSDGADDQPLL